MSDERLLILNMVADGRVTPEEGAHLLEALGCADKPEDTVTNTFKPGWKKGPRPFDTGNPVPPLPVLPSAKELERIISGAMKQAKGTIGPALRDGFRGITGWKSLRGIKTFVQTRYTGETKVMDLENRLEIPPGTSIRVQSLSGDITVRSYDGRVLATRAFGYTPLDAKGWRLDAEQSGNEILIRIFDNNDSSGLSGEMNYDILLPCDCTLNASSVSGDVDVEGANEGLWLQTVSGDIMAKGLSGPMDIRSTSGDISLAGCYKPTSSVESVSGDIRIRLLGTASPCSFIVKAVSGDIEMLTSVDLAVECKSFNGGIEQSGFEETGSVGNVRTFSYGTPTAAVGIETLSGDISLSVDG